ncbi:TetR/AcrR family transcriptional regulator [Pseudomonas abieticivorans]|uniref:TetR/AcrR family transcriptional regulator n=1 Tax=Pseudomonas abieticivorans TaxID=2931382 RepID=UPI0020C15FFE|nr:TetR/AcrR family transcriptional regulator [Pseudomonas sp. PIA16]
MSGLRERQKEARRHAISGAAVELFRSQGYGATTVEQIAEQAGVSAPTVFNYFGSKQEILIDLLREADEMALRDMAQLIPSFDDPVDALCHLESLVMTYELKVLPVSVWRELLPMSYGGPLPERLKLINETLNQEVSALLGHLQRQGKVRADINTEYTASVLNEYLTLQFLRLVSDDEIDLKGHGERVRQFMQLVFDGLRVH